MQALRAFGATPSADERIVEDGDIVTAAGVSAGIDLALWIAERIAGSERAKAIALAIEYDPQPPFHSGNVANASAGTIARANAILARDSITLPHMSSGIKVMWRAAIRQARVGRRRRRPVLPTR